ncbi:hypothetical protein ACOME3_004245 [Neoechinorhynchus agilis]
MKVSELINTGHRLTSTCHNFSKNTLYSGNLICIKCLKPSNLISIGCEGINKGALESVMKGTTDIEFNCSSKVVVNYASCCWIDEMRSNNSIIPLVLKLKVFATMIDVIRRYNEKFLNSNSSYNSAAFVFVGSNKRCF